jgi:ribose transport system permease protein
MAMQPPDVKAQELQSSPSGRSPRTRSSRIASATAFNRIGALYVLAAIIVVFSIWAPDTFPTMGTVTQILDSNSITALGALAIMVPLTTRTFDLSFAYVMTLTGVVVASLVVNAGVPVGASIVIALLVGLAMGVINGVVVVFMRIDSFIGTLATGSLVLALVSLISGEVPISGPKLNGFFAKIGQETQFGVTIPVVYCVVLGLLLWYVLEHTATGRRMYATGYNSDAARLAGVNTRRLRFWSLVACGVMSGFAGVVLAAILDTGSPDAGTPYLLQAFAAVFVGATQFKKGRFNVPGTILAVILLGTGTTGLGLAAAPGWSQDMFIGVALIIALAVTGIQRSGPRRIRRGINTSPGDARQVQEQ